MFFCFVLFQLSMCYLSLQELFKIWQIWSAHSIPVLMILSKYDASAASLSFLQASEIKNKKQHTHIFFTQLMNNKWVTVSLLLVFVTKSGRHALSASPSEYINITCTHHHLLHIIYIYMSYKLKPQLSGCSSGAVWESRWPYWAVRPNQPSGFRGHKELLNHALALVTTCP